MFIETAFRVLGLIPMPWAFRMSAVLGHMVFLADRKHREIAVKNLTDAFGSEKDQQEIRLLAKEVFKNLTHILFEIGWSLKLESKHFDRFFLMQGSANLHKAYKKGRGVIILTGHFGNWELLTVVAKMLGYPTSIVYRPLDSPTVNGFFEAYRTRFGGKLIPASWSVGKIFRSLKQGELVAILLDQNVDWYQGVFVDFFGRPACTNKGMALLALKTGAPVVPLFLVREHTVFRAIIGEEIPLLKTGDMTKDIEANTEQYNRVIESFVRRYPDQWFWVHQRWKRKHYDPWPRRESMGGPGSGLF